jgi:hypothetical protein
VLAVVSGRWAEGEAPQAIALFPLVFSSRKPGMLHVAAPWKGGTHHGVPVWLRVLSDWSMLGGVQVALVIFAAKTNELATKISQSGLRFSATSAVLTATAPAFAKRVA